MQYWLLKTEPEAFSWEDLLREQQSHWDGVGNYQARNNLKAMEKGDLAFFYYSGKQKGIVGVVEITSSYYQDPTTEDERWVAVTVEARERFKGIISLKTIKEDPELTEMVLVRNSRLSVQSVSASEFALIKKIAGGSNG